jgi:hypothetical protein
VAKFSFCSRSTTLVSCSWAAANDANLFSAISKT